MGSFSKRSYLQLEALGIGNLLWFDIKENAGRDSTVLMCSHSARDYKQIQLLFPERLLDIQLLIFKQPALPFDDIRLLTLCA